MMYIPIVECVTLVSEQLDQQSAFAEEVLRHGDRHRPR